MPCAADGPPLVTNLCSSWEIRSLATARGGNGEDNAKGTKRAEAHSGDSSTALAGRHSPDPLATIGADKQYPAGSVRTITPGAERETALISGSPCPDRLPRTTPTWRCGSRAPASVRQRAACDPRLISSYPGASRGSDATDCNGRCCLARQMNLRSAAAVSQDMPT